MISDALFLIGIIFHSNFSLKYQKMKQCKNCEYLPIEATLNGTPMCCNI